MDPKRFEAFEDDEYDESASVVVPHLQDKEEFKKLTREEIKKIAEEIGEVMNQEYLEQGLSERRRKKSARGE